MKPRVVVAELLDHLPATDVRAVDSRRDLMRLNQLMGHDLILARLWREACGSFATRPRHMVDFGAGDGTLACRVLARLPAAFRPDRITLIDRQDLVSPMTRGALNDMGVQVESIAADVFDWIKCSDPFDLGLANLFLHHFEGRSLHELLSGIARRARVFLAVEPRRSTANEFASRLLGLIGCNAVTRHDAVVSVQAGFQRDELSQHWPTSPDWLVVERRAGLFSHGFRATCHPPPRASIESS